MIPENPASPMENSDIPSSRSVVGITGHLTFERRRRHPACASERTVEAPRKNPKNKINPRKRESDGLLDASSDVSDEGEQSEAAGNRDWEVQRLSPKVARGQRLR